MEALKGILKHHTTDYTDDCWFLYTPTHTIATPPDSEPSQSARQCAAGVGISQRCLGGLVHCHRQATTPPPPWAVLVAFLCCRFLTTLSSVCLVSLMSLWIGAIAKDHIKTHVISQMKNWAYLIRQKETKWNEYSLVSAPAYFAWIGRNW